MALRLMAFKQIYKVLGIELISQPLHRRVPMKRQHDNEAEEASKLDVTLKFKALIFYLAEEKKEKKDDEKENVENSTETNTKNVQNSQKA